MKIVIIGLGSIGETILKSLSGEGHTITIIDENKDLVEGLIEKYDVFGVVGNGACMDIQEEANTGKGLKLGGWMRPYMTYVLPVVILIVFIMGLVDKFF